MKRFRVACVISAWIVFCGFQQPSSPHRKADQKTPDAAQADSAPKQKPPQSTVVAPPSNADAHSQGVEGDGNENIQIVTPAPEKPVDLVERIISIATLLCTVALAGAAIYGIRVALRTLDEMKGQREEMGKQVEAAIWQVRSMHEQVTEMTAQTALLERSIGVAKETADAALLNAKAVINAERPWLLIEYEWRKLEGLEGYMFYAVNKGETPAEIIEAHFKPEIVNRIADNLPLPPPVLNAPIFIPRRGDNLIVQGEIWYLNQVPIHPEDWIRNEGKLDEVMEAKAFPYFFGEIVYRDVIRPQRDKEGLHLTRCCFSYDAFMKVIRPTGPQEYRHKT